MLNHIFIQILFLALWWITNYLLLHIFSHLYGLLFYYLKVSFEKVTVLIFMKLNFSFFLCGSCLLCSKKTIANRNFQRFSLLEVLYFYHYNCEAFQENFCVLYMTWFNVFFLFRDIHCFQHYLLQIFFFQSLNCFGTTDKYQLIIYAQIFFWIHYSVLLTIWYVYHFIRAILSWLL